MTISTNWFLSKKHIASGIIKVVEFGIEFVDDASLAKTLHQGLIDVSSEALTDTSTDDEVLTVVQTVMEPNMPGLMAYMTDRLVLDALVAGATAVEVPPSVVTPEMVVAERQRLLAGGFDYDFGDSRGVHRIGTTAEDMIGWDEVSRLTQALISSGQPDATLTISTDTSTCIVTAAEWQQIILAGAAFGQPIYQASFAILKMSPIPTNYKELLQGV